MSGPKFKMAWVQLEPGASLEPPVPTCAQSHTGALGTEAPGNADKKGKGWAQPEPSFLERSDSGSATEGTPPGPPEPTAGPVGRDPGARLRRGPHPP